MTIKAIPTSERNLGLLHILRANEPDVVNIIKKIEWEVSDCYNLESYTAQLLRISSSVAAEAFANVSISISRIIENEMIEEENLAEGISLSIKEKINDQEITNGLKRIINLIIPIAKSEKLKILNKSLDVMYSGNYHFHDFKIISVIKPIFNSEREDIVNFIVSNHMVLRISDGLEMDKEYAVEIGYKELKKFGELIENALKKVETAEHSLRKITSSEIVRYDPAN